jgi:2-polyprenyl-6-methoxyphenol hydroxylase-like FAD-dependent oxidoreductase
VIEQAPKLSAVSLGGGLHIWSNGMRALRELGVADDVAALGGDASRLRSAEFYNWRGRLLGGFDVAEIERRLGEPTVGVIRSELHALLAEQVGSDGIRLGSACTGFSESAGGVIANLADGSDERGAVLVGADGLHSAIRGQLHGDRSPRSASLSYVQGTTRPLETTPPGVLRVFYGPGARFLFYPVGPDRQFWEAAFVAGPDEEVPMDRFAQLYSGWPSPIESLLHSTESSALSAGHAYDRPPLNGWGRGRVTLLGDAAHPMTNGLAQGANQALEDAIVLANCLAADAEPARQLRAYEELREGRTASIARRSAAIARAVRLRRVAPLKLRDTLMEKVLFTPRGFRQQLKDLDYSFD